MCAGYRTSTCGAPSSSWGPALPDSPLLVFINSRSGGRAGTRLAEVLCHAIGHSQVPERTSPSRPLHSMLPLVTMEANVLSPGLQLPGTGTCTLTVQQLTIMSSQIDMDNVFMLNANIYQHEPPQGWMRHGCWW